MTCQQLTELVTDYAEGRLRFFRRVELRVHLAMCAHCRAYLQQMKATRDALGRLPAEPMPDEMKQELLRHLRSLPPPTGG
jgi:anti-sigma factor RsiW